MHTSHSRLRPLAAFCAALSALTLVAAGATGVHSGVAAAARRSWPSRAASSAA